MKHPICSTSNDALVYVDLIASAAATHIAQQPHLLGLVEEVVGKMTLRDPEISIEYDMERVIGYDYVVRTVSTDTIFYAQPLRDDVYSRYVKNGKPAPAQHLALVLRRDDEGGYELLDTWIGRLNPPRPGSANETADSKTYWETHAFISDQQPIQLRTCTKVCPY